MSELTKPRADVASIVSTPGTCGGRPRIEGTRITVQNVVLWHNRMGMTFEDILEGYPHLTVAGLTMALAYYEDHRQEIDRNQKETDEFVDRMEAEWKPRSLLARSRKKADAQDDPISPG